MTRRFVDAPSAERCTATIKLRDGSTARCGRKAMHTGKMLCTQHYKLLTYCNSCDAPLSSGYGPCPTCGTEEPR